MIYKFGRLCLMNWEMQMLKSGRQCLPDCEGIVITIIELRKIR